MIGHGLLPWLMELVDGETRELILLSLVIKSLRSKIKRVIDEFDSNVKRREKISPK